MSKGGKVPFILLADFNEDPHTLAEPSWGSLLRATFVAPSHVTCRQGNGSIIDFALISDCLVPSVTSLESVTCVDFGPHNFLALSLDLEQEH